MKTILGLSSNLINMKLKYSESALFITFLFLLLLTGCGGGGGSSNNEVDKKSPPINFSDYYPLSKRISHDYNVTSVSGDLSTVSQTWTTGLTYNGQTSIRTCESATEWEDQAHINGQTLSYAFSDNTGTIVISDVPIILGVDNWQAGQTITSNANFNYGSAVYPLKAEVTYIDIEPVTVPAGSFPDSIKVNFSINDGVLTGTSWYAKDVGLIKGSDSDGEIWELTSQNTLPSVFPLLSTIEPATGSLYGGGLVTLTGMEFLSGTSMTIGGKLVSSISIKGSNSIMAVTPSGTLGSADVTVTSPDCQVAHIENGYVFNDGTVPPPSIASWRTEVIDDPKFFSDFYARAIAVDSQGRPHIVYGGDHLYYVFYNGSNWQYEIADSSSGVGKYASIVLDAGGKAHISYYKESSRQIKYATNSSGSWSSEIVSGSLGSNGFTSTVIDSSGYIHISYKTNLDIKYATNKSGTWLVETVDTGATDITGLEGENTSIAIDASGKAHISYFYDTDSSLKYATNTSGLWVAVTVDDAPNAFAGQFNSLAVDSLGKIHISYYYVDYDTNIAAVKYASNASGSWSTETVFSSADNGALGSTSIALDSSDFTHLSYSDWSTSSVRYTNNTSGSWVTGTVDTTGVRITSIALDASANAHISYYDSLLSR